MAVNKVDTQQGATITLPDSFTHPIIRIGRVKRSKPVIDVTDLGATDQRNKLIGDLADIEQFEVEVQSAPGAAEPGLGNTGTVTITGPVPGGASAGEVQTGTGGVVAIAESEYQSNTEAIQTKIFTVVFTGATNGGTKYSRTAATPTV